MYVQTMQVCRSWHYRHTRTDCILQKWLQGGIKKAFIVKKPITPAERIARMDAMFEEEFAVLTEDYEFFTQTLGSGTTPDAPKPPSKSPRKSGKPSSPQDPKPS